MQPGAARIIDLEEIDSTNAEARRLAEAGDPGPLWIAARRQTAGRGRRGRAWESGEGNLAATHLFATNKPPGEAAQMSFVAAVAVADVLNAFGPAELIALKWPNDPLIDGRKAGGILVESGRLADERLWLAVGCGVNLAWAPQAVERPATCLAEHLAGAPPTPREALTLLVSAMESWRDVWERQGFAPIARAWTRRAHGLGSPCTARLTHETISGIAEGLEDDGALRLRLEDGSVRRVTAGDVFF